MLASASPRRRELLSQIRARFRVDAADVDETILPGTPARDAAVALALKKAQTVSARASVPVLAADTIVVAADGGILGKPASTSEAAAMLRRLSGTTHHVVTGVCLAFPGGRAPRTAIGVTAVTMRPLSDTEILGYAASGEPFGKAGGYAIQEKGDRFVTSVAGSWSNVVGLPLEIVEPMLREEGLL